ncbi:MAG: replicative DNA helicase [Cyclobacteriaceae bacterium]
MSSDNSGQKANTKNRRNRIGGLLNTVGANALGKLPPQAIELEEAVLGALMLEKEALTTVIDILKPESFYKDSHREIYQAILQLFDNSEPIDMLTVTNQLRKNATLEFVGGAFFVSGLTQKVNSAANVEFHARIISEQAIKRELITIASEIEQEAYEDTTDTFTLLDKVEQKIFGVSESNIRKNYADMRSIMRDAINELEAKKLKKDGLTGVPSGFSALDRVTSGWQRSDMVIIAARPGMGKCLGKGTKVLMYDGSLRKVEDVVEGDLLMGDDSTPRRVLSIARGRERMYWIRQNKGIDYRVNESHILSLKRSRREGNHQKGEVLNISVKEYLEKSDKFKSSYKGYKVAVEFEDKPQLLDAYILGLWLGDGDLHSSIITSSDPEVVESSQIYAQSLSEAGNKAVLSTYDYPERCNQYAITQGRQGGGPEFSVKNELRKLGLLGNKHIPQDYLINSTNKRLKLLAGLIDSDGHFLEQSNGYEISQSQKELAQQIKFLCDSLGFRTSIRKKRASISHTGYESESYCIRIYGDIDRIPVRIGRKQARPRCSQVDWQVTDIRVEYDKVDDYYGFEIDGNRLFLLEDMTVTHNTAFVLSALRNAAVDFGHAVAIFSLEMSAVQLVNRLISAEAQLESEKIKKGSLADFEWEQLYHKTSDLTEAPIFIDDTPALSIRELRSKCRRLKAQHNIELIIVDYLQLMSGDSSKGNQGNREQEIASISRAMKNIAKELDVPVLALSQLSRAVETRGGDKRPQLSDLRESGSIEQDADMVMFLYRPEYYGITEDENGQPVQGTGEVIIAKHRNGALDTVRLKFIGKYTKFTNLDDTTYDNNYGNNLISAGSSEEFNDSNIVTYASKANNRFNKPGGGQGGEPFSDDQAPF